MPSETGITLGLIPARSGSKGVPGKNLRAFGGRSLVARAVTACRDSGAVDHVFVSTDDSAIAEEAKRAGAAVPFLRPAELATDDTPAGPVIDHALGAFEDYLGIEITTLVFTEPTVPFRTSRHIAKAVARYREGDVRSVIGVCALERKPHNIFTKTPGGTLERYIKQPQQAFARRQEMNALCRLSSGVYVVGRDDYLETKSLTVEPIGFIAMTAIESINIDEEIDVLLAEAAADAYGI